MHRNPSNHEAVCEQQDDGACCGGPVWLRMALDGPGQNLCAVHWRIRITAWQDTTTAAQPQDVQTQTSDSS